MAKSESISILLVDPDSGLRRGCAELLGQEFTVLLADCYELAEQLLAVHEVHVLVTEQDIGDPGGLALVTRLHNEARNTTRVMVAARIPEGAWDVVDFAFPKPIQPHELRDLVRAIVTHRVCRERVDATPVGRD